MHFIDIALGSSAELETQMMLAERIGYASNPELTGHLTEIRRMLVGLHQSLRNK
jgi:four helix bundle protein